MKRVVYTQEWHDNKNTLPDTILLNACKVQLGIRSADGPISDWGILFTFDEAQTTSWDPGPRNNRLKAC